jgi:hypothetical protein
MIDNIIIGISIIRQYCNEKYLYAEHDVIYFGPYQETYDKMSEQEKALMESLGWHEESDSWAHYT